MRNVEAWLARREARPAPALCALALVLAGLVSPWWFATPDSVVYLSMARSLARTGRLAAFGAAHTGLTPGYPIVIAPTFWVSERPFLAISVVHWALAVAAMVSVHRWARSIVPDAALVVTFLVFVNVAFWIWARRPLSEIAFLPLLVAASLSFERTLARRFAGLVLLGALVSVREVGAVLALGFLMAALRAPPSRSQSASLAAALLLLAAGGAAVFAIVVRDSLAPVGGARVLGTHLDGFLDPRLSVADRVVEGARLRITEIGRLLVPGMFKAYSAERRWLDWNMLVYVPVAAIIGGGWIRLARRSADPLLLAFPFYVAVYVLWPFDGGTRYLAPMLPVLVASLWPWLERHPRRLTFFTALAVLHCTVTIAYELSRELPRARDCHAGWPDVEAEAASMRDDSPAILSPTVPQCRALMLSFLLDRPVAWQSPLPPAR